MNGSESGDLGEVRLSGGMIGGEEQGRAASIADRRRESESGGLDLPELLLPDSALPIPSTAPPAPTATAPLLRTPDISDAPSPAKTTTRTRFDLSGTPATPHLRGNDIPLRPILQLPSSPQLDSPRYHLRPLEENDITSSLDERERDSSVPVPHSPVFAPRDDDEPHPEHDPFDYDANHEGETPHPLYTPAPRRRRKRRRSKSVASSRTARSGRSRLRKVWKTILRGGKKKHGTSSYGGDSSSSSSSSDSSSTDGSDTHSSGSRSTWAGWRFWRNSSSGSSSSSDTSDNDSDDEWEPPTPHFTLLTPCLGRPVTTYPSHLEPGSEEPHPGDSIPATKPESPPLDSAAPDAATTPKKKVFDLSSSATIAPTLKRLEDFWLERRQDDALSGDIGAGASAVGAAGSFGAEVDLQTQDEMSYFAQPEPRYDDEEEEEEDNGNDLTPLYGPCSGGPPTTPMEEGRGNGLQPKKTRGEERAKRAEVKRLGKRGMEEGPAWWLDVMCPSVADLRKLRKLLPLHPLTMEDILHQETREKIEFFPALGYYFVVFRALDETYFKYTSPEATPTSSTDELNSMDGEKERKKSGVPWEDTNKKGRVDIVEGLNGKEGVEGVGLGAVNIYLVVFGDGIISFHYEDISKHSDRVQGKLQQFGLSRNMSSHWIAYGLMDSIVDAFFPLVDFVETESNHIDTFLSDPLSTGSTHSSGAPSPGHKHYDDKVVGIMVESKTSSNEEKRKSSSASSSVKKATVKRRSIGSTLRQVPAIVLPAFMVNHLPRTWVSSRSSTTQDIMMVDASGFKVSSMVPILPYDSGSESSGSTFDLNIFGAASSHYDRLAMLKRITDTRKLVTGLGRLLGPKADVVRGLRRRTKEKDLKMFQGADSTHDIAIYVGDLYDHIVAIQQTLTFYDSILSHDHPAFTGMMRLALAGTKVGTDSALVKLYIVTLTFLPLNIMTGLFSLNIVVPHNGDRDTHLEPDGSVSPYNVFYSVLGGVVVVCCLIWFAIWLIFKSSKHQANKRRNGAMMPS